MFRFTPKKCVIFCSHVVLKDCTDEWRNSVPLLNGFEDGANCIHVVYIQFFINLLLVTTRWNFNSWQFSTHVVELSYEIPKALLRGFKGDQNI